MSLQLEPKAVFDWFYALNQIPRGSGQEKQVSDFLVNFAKERNLEVSQDELFNVIIRKPASKGFENSVPVIIQGHMDMVCVKTDDSDHDFSKDPIEMIVDGDYLHANKTSLGGDDGIAVAFALAILDGNYQHPALEVLITTNEETGMDGAAAIKPGMLKGKRLINIDSEDEGIFLVSCAGGVTLKMSFDITEEKFAGKAYEITISGLQGGHSGQMIGDQRANANKLLARILHELRKDTELRIVDIVGGSKHNAIPNFAKAAVLLADDKNAKKIIADMSKVLRDEYAVADSGLKIECKATSADKAFSKKLTDSYIDFFMMVQDGVVAMSKSIDGLVQTSLNNAVVAREANKLTVTTSVRSSAESQLDMMIESMKIICGRVGASLEQFSRYPAWQYEENSVMRDTSLATYKELFGKEATYSAIHAGLECGLLKKVLPDCDMVSYGPDMHDVHSVKERISISSCRRMWQFTLKLLENLK